MILFRTTRIWAKPQTAETTRKKRTRSSGSLSAFSSSRALLTTSPRRSPRLRRRISSSSPRTPFSVDISRILWVLAMFFSRLFRINNSRRNKQLRFLLSLALYQILCFILLLIISWKRSFWVFILCFYVLKMISSNLRIKVWLLFGYYYI